MAQTATTTEKPVQPVPEIDAAVKAERERIQARNTEVSTMFQPYLYRPDVQDLYHDVLANTSVDAATASRKLLDQLGRDMKPLMTMGAAAPAGYLQREDNMQSNYSARGSEFQAAVTDSILMRYGVPVKDPHPAVRDVRGMGAAEICGAILSQRGQTTRGMSKAQVIQATMTTSDLPVLLENIATKSLMTGFRESEAASHRIWTREGTLPDFKEARRVALSEAPALAEVPEAAEYTYGGLTDAAETIKLATYGKIVKLTRQALVNDDLGELARLPLAMGQAAARAEADLVYTLLTSNPAMRDSENLFSVAHANIGTAAALSVESLGAARTLMRRQRGLAGTATLNIVPRYLIVPASLETAAEQLLASIAPATTSAAVPEWVRQLTVVTDSRLDDDSTTAWYLAAAPEQFDTIEVARLDGNGAQAFTDEDFGTDAMRFKIRLDTGAAVLDWRGLVYNAGG